MLGRKKTILVAGLILVAAAGAGINANRTVPYGALFERSAPTGLSLVVNAPANRLYVYRDGVKIRTYKVSIGKRGFETPPGQYRVDHVVWNPWWHPPASSWARDAKVTPPGPDNPMGRAKLFFGNLLYIHGTPHERQLGEPASHGCVRMANADVMELARLVHEYGAPATATQIEALAANPNMSRTVWLKTKVPLAINYDLVDVVDGKVEIYPDVYKRSTRSVKEHIVQTLVHEGVDASGLDDGKLSRLLEKFERRGVTTAMSLDELVASVASTDE
jgi:murein L,D-transpeptidase YcbB/YkuD